MNPYLAAPPRGYAWFLQLADFTALKRGPDGYYHRNLERGVLLHNLAREIQPMRVLELGTGRAYATLCIAAALADQGRGSIDTVDVRSIDEPFSFALMGTPPQEEERSLRDVLAERADRELLKRCRFHVGPSAWVTSRLVAAGHSFDLIFIDGDHTEAGCRRDFVAALRAAAPDCTIVFDDYQLEGVRNVVDHAASLDGTDLSVVRTLGAISDLAYGFPPDEPGQAMPILHVADRDALLHRLGLSRRPSARERLESILLRASAGSRRLRRHIRRSALRR